MRRIFLRMVAALLVIGALFWFFMPSKNRGEQLQDTPQETVASDAVLNASVLTFPHTLPTSGLVLEELICYNGIFWEDVAQNDVSQIVGLMVYNPMERMVEFGAITLEQNGKQLYFFVYCLPPGSRCLVLEKHQQVYSDAAITACRELNIRWDYQDLKREEVDYLGFGQKLTVINRSSRQQKHVTLWYKYYSREKEYYLGGVAYSAHLFRLNAYEQSTLTPTHYDAGQCKIVAIELEN